DESDAIGEQRARWLAIDALAFEANLPRSRNEHSKQGLEHGRLAGAVRPDEKRYLALARVERRLVEYGQARRVAGDDLVELDHSFTHCARSRVIANLVFILLSNSVPNLFAH